MGRTEATSRSNESSLRHGGTNGDEGCAGMLVLLRVSMEQVREGQDGSVSGI